MGNRVRRLATVVSWLLCIGLILALAACGGDTATGGKSSVSGRGLAKTRPDPLLERRIVLLHPESGESLNARYYHDGRYDQAVLAQINRLFRDRHADAISEIDPELIDYLVDIRTRLNLPASVTFEILSGYRTSETNAMLSQRNANVAKESLHIHGWAVDFRIAHVDGRAICAVAETMQRGGVAFYPRDNHVHVDIGNIRTWNTNK
jgi:uncharacterized protein YcbK (DUF882 family)